MDAHRRASMRCWPPACSRVVYAIGDPNPRVNGAGARRLADAGVEVQAGLLEREAAALNAGFFMRMRQGRPFVRLKSAMSLDGRTALANGASKWITSEEARADVQHWRAQSGAMLTSAATVLADDPQARRAHRGSAAAAARGARPASPGTKERADPAAAGRGACCLPRPRHVA